MPKRKLLLEAKNLVKKFGQKTVINNVSLRLYAGEIVGLLGPNGAGKTTTMRLLTGFLTPNKGKVIAKKEEIGYLPEDNPLYPQFTPWEYLAFVAQMYQVPKKQLRNKILTVATECGITEVISQPIDTLSRGYKQRVGLAATLIHNPKILILDEPTVGLDPNQQIEIRRLIKEIAKTRTILLSSHNLAEVQSICQRVIIINKGKIVAEGRLKQLTKRKSLEALFRELTQ